MSALAAPQTDLALAQRALAMGVAGATVSGFTGSARNETAGAIYGTLVPALLIRGQWQFNTATVRLSRLTAAPLSRWAYAFDLPADRLGNPLAVYFDKTARSGETRYEYFEGQLWCDAEEAYVTYQRAPNSPASWDPLFRDFATYALAAEYALDIGEDRSRYETLKIAAYGSLDESRIGGKLALALAREMVTTPPPVLMSHGGPLLAARHGGV